MRRIDDIPGFRRRFAVVPVEGQITAALEDDIHCMAVTLLHDGQIITAVYAEMTRWPWDTCPAAETSLRSAFEGVELSAAIQRGGKKRNCTHLYDLAELAAAHALDSAPTHFEMLVSDPVDGLVRAELRRNGVCVLHWTLEGMALVEPTALAGTPLLHLRDWISTLELAEREAARMLQWGCVVAHGRTLPWEYQADAKNMPANCHTFQPHNAEVAKRIGLRHDFSAGGRVPLSSFTGKGLAP